MSDETKYFEEYLDNILRFYCKEAFKDKGWYVAAIDPVKGKVIFKSDALSRMYYEKIVEEESS